MVGAMTAASTPSGNTLARLLAVLAVLQLGASTAMPGTMSRRLSQLSRATATADATAVTAQGIQGPVDGGGSTARASASAESFANVLGAGPGASQCVARAAAQAGAGGVVGAGGASANAQSSSISGSLLDGLAGCGAMADATANALSCQRVLVPLGTTLCGLAGQFGTNCPGLRLVNPGLGDGVIAPGATINVPPCSIAG